MDSAVKQTMRGNKDYVSQVQWLKPYLQLISAREFSQVIKPALAALHRFLSIPADSAYSERVLNELILVLINCKFAEIDIHDTYNTSILILKVLEAVFIHPAVVRLRADTVIALLDYLEDESQLEGLREISKILVSAVVRAMFQQNAAPTEVQTAIFQHVCHSTDQLCGNREALKSSSDYTLKLKSVDALSFNLSLLLRVVKLIGPHLDEESALLASVRNRLCPLLHQVWHNSSNNCGIAGKVGEYLHSEVRLHAHLRGPHAVPPAPSSSSEPTRGPALDIPLREA